MELALVGNAEVRDTIDRAWGVVHNKHRKKETLAAPIDPTDPHSKDNLSVNPVGRDSGRRRYWAFDGILWFAPVSIHRVTHTIVFACWC